jgi:type IV pilus assembly protein PilE
MRIECGFTLIEIIMVIIILGVLASWAVPRITQSQEVARLSEAVQILKSYRGAEERWLLDHGAYTADCTDLDVAATPSNFDVPTCAANGVVSIQRTGGAYTVTATPPVTAGQKDTYNCAACSAFLNRYLP